MDDDRARPGTAVHPAVPALTGPAVSGITRLTAIDTVRARIGLAVELGLLEPGDRLPAEREMAHALAVSPITVRRALVSLTADGVLVRRRGRDGGTFVADSPPSGVVPSTAEYLRDASEVHRLIDRRMLLECALAHFAAITATERDVAAMRAAVDRMTAAATWADYHSADEQFHRAVAQSSGLGFAQEPYAAALTDLYRYFLPYPIEYLHGVNDDHAALVAAIVARDVVEAVAITQRHVSDLHRTMFPTLVTRERPGDRG